MEVVRDFSPQREGLSSSLEKSLWGPSWAGGARMEEMEGWAQKRGCCLLRWDSGWSRTAGLT